MNLDRVFNVASAIVAVAMVTTIVSHPATANIIRATGDMFTGALRAAQGR